ncbi:hypothetical protein INT45_007884 [Circinella minor]|uniref:BHLH domain-containing protein n=1 Tax=Circinella minor TaxID=1195481 RepID=A0A8H7S6R5_9FUNG|nr:hypothetical protein INT45_007884 [Circinella minor]
MNPSSITSSSSSSGTFNISQQQNVFIDNNTYNTVSQQSIQQSTNSNNNNNNHDQSIQQHDNIEEQVDDKSSTDNKKSTSPRRSRKAPHELLTEAEKKANHIASEQKRRQNIRLGFDQLIEIVPSLNHGNRSEALILQKSIEHIRGLVSVKNDLKSQVRDLEILLGHP